jgi:hypothetical protein
MKIKIDEKNQRKIQKNEIWIVDEAKIRIKKL